MHKKFIKQPNILFIQFGQYTGQLLFSIIACRAKNIANRIASFHYDCILNLNCHQLLRAIVDEAIGVFNLNNTCKLAKSAQKVECSQFY